MKVQIWLLFLGCLRGVSLPDSVDRCNWNIHGGCPDRDNLAWDCLAESKECPPGQQYHCTRRIDNPTEYIDGCAVSKICLAGEAPYLVKDNLVQCSDCHSKEFFNSAESMNSSMYSECTFKAECDREVGVECNPIDPNSTDIYKYDRQCRCPARENYVFAHGREDSHKMCRSSDDVMGSFRCRKVAPCPSGEERLLNYTCGPKCAEGHRTNTSDECVPPFSTSNTMTAKTNTPIYSSKLMSKISPDVSSPPSTSTTTTTPTTTTTTHETWRISKGAIAGIASGCAVVVLALLILICVMYRKKLILMARETFRTIYDQGNEEVEMESLQRGPPCNNGNGEVEMGPPCNNGDEEVAEREPLRNNAGGEDEEEIEPDQHDPPRNNAGGEDEEENEPDQHDPPRNNGRPQNNEEYHEINFEVTDEDTHGLNPDQLDRLATLMIRKRDFFKHLMIGETNNILDHIYPIENFMMLPLLSSIRSRARDNETDANREILDNISNGGYYKYIHFKKILIHVTPHKCRTMKLLEKEMKVVDKVRNESGMPQASDNDCDNAAAAPALAPAPADDDANNLSFYAEEAEDLNDTTDESGGSLE